MARTKAVPALGVAIVGLGLASAPAHAPAAATFGTPNPIAGAIDFHAYTAPDYFPRDLNDIEVARLAARNEMRGLVLMSHVTSTADRAALVHMLVPEIEVFGGVVLNRAVGGLNPEAIRAMAGIQGGRGRVVWLPTIDADHHRKVLGMAGEGIVVAVEDQLTPEAEAVLTVVAEHGLVLATGHVSPPEVLAVVRRARALGIEHVVVTSPMSLPGLSIEQMRQAAEMGAKLELDYVNALMGKEAHLEWMRTWPRVSVPQMAEAVKTIGAEHFILGTELGQVGNPIVPDGYVLLIEGFREAGVTQAQIDQMMKQNPAELLDLE